MDIAKIIDRIIEVEGGYVDHPSDKGGPTCWGITEQVARNNGFTGRMEDLPKSFAFAIYEREYVISPGFDLIGAISIPVAGELVDTGVNMGQKQAAKFLQSALNGLNRQQRDYADLVVDGAAGRMTREALKAFLSIRGVKGQEVLLKALNCLQGARYIEIADSRTKNEDFLFGWLDHRVKL